MALPGAYAPASIETRKPPVHDKAVVLSEELMGLKMDLKEICGPDLCSPEWAAVVGSYEPKKNLESS
jgi:hypothetical protein